MKKNLDISFKKPCYNEHILPVPSPFALRPSLYHGSTVLNFIYFSKSGGGAEPPQPGLCNTCSSSKGGNTEQKLENSVYIIRGGKKQQGIAYASCA